MHEDNGDENMEVTIPNDKTKTEARYRAKKT